MKVYLNFYILSMILGFQAWGGPVVNPGKAIFYNLMYEDPEGLKALQGSTDPTIKKMVDENIQIRTRFQEVNKEIVNSCLNQVEVGTSTSVSIPGYFKCDSSSTLGKYQYQDAVYKLRKEKNGKLSIRYQINAQILPFNISERRKAEIVRTTQDCLKQANEVWNRYNVDFNVDLKVFDQRMNTSVQHLVFINDKVGRSNSGEWMFRGQSAKANDRQIKDGYCKTIIHETAHLLGLADTYAEPEKCPDRETVRPAFSIPPDIMDNVFLGGTEIYPDHLKAIIGPLCPASQEVSEQSVR